MSSDHVALRAAVHNIVEQWLCVARGEYEDNGNRFMDYEKCREIIRRLFIGSIKPGNESFVVPMPVQPETYVQSVFRREILGMVDAWIAASIAFYSHGIRIDHPEDRWLEDKDCPEYQERIGPWMDEHRRLDDERMSYGCVVDSLIRYYGSTVWEPQEALVSGICISRQYGSSEHAEKLEGVLSRILVDLVDRRPLGSVVPA